MPTGIESAFILIAVLIFSVIVHEVMHGVAAERLRSNGTLAGAYYTEPYSAP